MKKYLNHRPNLREAIKPGKLRYRSPRVKNSGGDLLGISPNNYYDAGWRIYHYRNSQHTTHQGGQS